MEIEKTGERLGLEMTRWSVSFQQLESWSQSGWHWHSNRQHTPTKHQPNTTKQQLFRRFSHHIYHHLPHFIPVLPCLSKGFTFKFTKFTVQILAKS
jgi:hypothetical protein